MPANAMQTLLAEFRTAEAKLRTGGGTQAIARQHGKGRLTARERIARLTNDFFELSLWAAWNMYTDFGGAPSAGVVTGVGTVGGRQVMLIANDATVKAGAFFPMTVKKVLRAQRIARDNRLPLVYLVDSAGVFLPLQEEEKRSSPTKTTLAASFAITPSFPRWASHSTPPSWATVSPAAAISRSCATSC
jgi:acetyl-CoA carboxylase carboxyltransferase component